MFERQEQTESLSAVSSAMSSYSRGMLPMYMFLKSAMFTDRITYVMASIFPMFNFNPSVICNVKSLRTKHSLSTFTYSNNLPQQY